jgi:hypothetical protein
MFGLKSGLPFWFLGAPASRSGFPLQLLRNFRFNPLRGQLVSQSPLPYRRRGVKPTGGEA